MSYRTDKQTGAELAPIGSGGGGGKSFFDVTIDGAGKGSGKYAVPVEGTVRRTQSLGQKDKVVDGKLTGGVGKFGEDRWEVAGSVDSGAKAELPEGAKLLVNGRVVKTGQGEPQGRLPQFPDSEPEPDPRGPVFNQEVIVTHPGPGGGEYTINAGNKIRKGRSTEPFDKKESGDRAKGRVMSGEDVWTVAGGVDFVSGDPGIKIELADGTVLKEPQQQEQPPTDGSRKKPPSQTQPPDDTQNRRERRERPSPTDPQRPDDTTGQDPTNGQKDGKESTGGQEKRQGRRDRGPTGPIPDIPASEASEVEVISASGGLERATLLAKVSNKSQNRVLTGTVEVGDKEATNFSLQPQKAETFEFSVTKQVDTESRVTICVNAANEDYRIP